MSKGATFVCNACGAVYRKWQGRCDACGEWNSISEERAENFSSGKKAKKGGREIEFASLEGVTTDFSRISTGISELDRVCGGGLVAGSALLVGGDPGIGKSTILLQATAKAALKNPNAKCIYISGEESIDQVRMRAARLGLSKANVDLAATGNLKDIITTLENYDKPDVVVIDSIQTMFLDDIESAPGTVSQVRMCGHELVKLAKKKGFALFLVGHVTKEGNIAGPRVLEHMVDTVLYFEGDRGHQFRILRAVKNRFGATDEIGVFEMTALGLEEVANPSAMFLAERRGNVNGSCVFAGIEGSRPMLVEIQALVAPASYTPRRAVVGWDSGRLAMVTAVLEARCGLVFSGKDIYLNVAGGLKITEPAADMAVATALISALTGVPASPDMVVFGEIGLSGEVRAVPQTELRIKEAVKLGFSEIVLPRSLKKGKKIASDNSKDYLAKEIGHLHGLVEMFTAQRTDL
ncbi:MAG: DNA repair protein RadA [Alphaproteobacteria bacterium]